MCTLIYDIYWHKVHNWWKGRCNSDATFLFDWLHYNPDHHSTTVLQTPCTLCLLILRNNMEKQWDCKYHERERDLQMWMPCPHWPHIDAEHLILLQDVTWKPAWEELPRKDVSSKIRLFWHRAKGPWLAPTGIPALIPVLFLCSNNKLIGKRTSLRMLLTYLTDMPSQKGHVSNL